MAVSWRRRIRALLRDRRRAAVLAVLLVVIVGGVLAVVLGGGDGDGGGDAAAGDTTTTTMETGGIQVAAPDGWRAIPMPQFGAGVAIPEDWEATVLSGDVLADLESSSPAVPGFLEAAHAAAESEAVFYAAGVDGEGRISDLKVRADLDTGVTDAAGLEAYALGLAQESGAVAPETTVVEGAALPTVEVRYTVEVERPAEDDEADGESAGTERVTVQGTDHLVLGPRGVVYSLVVTSEVAAADHDSLAGRLFGTLSFPAD
jgi:hypothetical protein